MIPMRFACLFWWIAVSITSIGAVEQRDWHLLVVQITEALVALVLWFSVDSDTDKIRPPTFATRPLRLTLYVVTLLLGLATFVPWQWPVPDKIPIRDATLFMVVFVVVSRFFDADWKREVTP